MGKAGRPSKYGGINLEQVRKLAELGLTDKELGNVLGICEDTVHEYNKIPEFKAALTAGKKVSDDRVVKALFERATGYSHPQEEIFCSKEGYVTRVQTVKHYPPDTVACIFWLKNRMPKEFKDKIVHAGDEDAPLGVIMYPAKKQPGEP